MFNQFRHDQLLFIYFCQVEIREPVKGKSGTGFKETTETLRTFEKSISSFVQVD